MNVQKREQSGVRVKQSRIEAGYTQEQLAEMAGITANTVRAIEQGRPTRDGSLMAVANVLGLSMGGYAPDVEIVRDVVGEWLESLSRDERIEARKQVMRLVFTFGKLTSNPPGE